MLVLHNRDILDPATTDEFDRLHADLGVRLTNEHDDEGRHTPYEDYTPEWRAFTTNVSLGNGTITGRWCRRGTQVSMHLELKIGDTSTMGVGPWSFSLPVRPRDYNNVFTAALLDSSAARVYPGTFRNPFDFNYDGMLIRGNAVDGQFISATIPFTWAVGDTLFLNGTYEAMEAE